MGSTNPNVWNGNIKEDRKSSFKKTVYLTLSERAFSHGAIVVMR
ncbi:hypothetical protein [Aneurinibacillus tyrosinisolvens]|nr:hypothetical protein [Aneurinibacillus tyrosinisolvens]